MVQILHEGMQDFEQAGFHWHLDCFSCVTCGSRLDSDASLLLLGGDTRVCSDCTYHCAGCGDEIEDLAIATGDRTFCAGCFRCRICQ
ncbi:hypothetical protein BJ166DRAFT_590870 [Pestalotiopsis sp. NC0098]|nr:hypothetical protein BJ166DRAFT_590870 [Pestalotiopsis sp. NC0098]